MKSLKTKYPKLPISTIKHVIEKINFDLPIDLTKSKIFFLNCLKKLFRAFKTDSYFRLIILNIIEKLSKFFITIF